MCYDIEKSGERIRQLRMRKGLTQGETADALKIDRSFYSRIEAGKKGCSVDLFVQVSLLFDVSLDYLILGKYLNTQLDRDDQIQLKDDITKLIARLEQLKSAL